MSTLIEIRMPAPAPDIEEVDVIAWLIEPGARVERGDPILEVETEKSTLEVEAPASGTLAEIVVPGGASGIAVGALLGRIEATASETPTPEAVTDAAEPARDAAPEPEASAVEQEPLDPGLASSSPATQHLDPADADPVDAEAAPPSTALARRLAEQSGLKIQEMPGSGAHGRVLRADVERELAGQGSAQGRGEARVRLEADCDAGDLVAILQEFAGDSNVGEIPLEAFLLRAVAAALRGVSDTPESVSIRVARVHSPGAGRRVEDADRRGLASLARELSDDAAEEPGVQAPPADLLLEHLDVEGIDRHWPAPANRARFSVGVAVPRPQPVIRDGVVAPGQGLGLTLCAASEAEAPAAAQLLAHLRRLIENPLEMTL